MTEKPQPITGGLAQWRQLSRRQYYGNLHVITPQQVQWKPPLRQAAGTLEASEEQRSRQINRKLKVKRNIKNEQ